MSAGGVEVTALRVGGGGVAFVHRRRRGKLRGTLEGDFGFTGLMTQQQRLADPGEEFGIGGELDPGLR